MSVYLDSWVVSRFLSQTLRDEWFIAAGTFSVFCSSSSVIQVHTYIHIYIHSPRWRMTTTPHQDTVHTCFDHIYCFPNYHSFSSHGPTRIISFGAFYASAFTMNILKRSCQLYVCRFNCCGPESNLGFRGVWICGDSERTSRRRSSFVCI